MVAVAVIVPLPPNATATPLKVTDALAKRACAKVPELMFVAEIAVTLAPDPLSVPIKLPDEVLPVTASALSVPTLVMLGCAAVVTVPAVVAAPVNAPTNVVLVTLVNPATVVTVAPNVSAVEPSVTELLLRAPFGIEVNPAPDPLNWLPVTVPVADTSPAVRILPPCTLAVTVRALSVPTDVILVCAAVSKVPAMLVNAPRVPDTLPLVILPVTARLDNVPTLVMLGCAAVVTVPATVAVPTVKLAAVPVSPVPAPINWPAVVTLPEELIAPEFNEVNVPTEVILGCAAVVTVPAVVAELAAPVNAPTNVVLVTLVNPATVVTVEPRVSAVLPSVTELLLRAPLGIEVNPVPAPVNELPETVPVADTSPAVRMLPPATLPVTLAVVKKAVPQKLLAPPKLSVPLAVGVIPMLLCQLVVALL